MGNISSYLTPNSLRSIFSFVAGEAIYIWHLEENLDTMKTEFDRLIRKRDDLLNEIEIAEQQPMKRRTNQVIGWLERVQKMEPEFGELEKAGSRELDNLCLGGFCSKNLMSGYDIGKKVTKLTEKVTRLKDERGDIKDVAETIPQGPAVELSVDPTIIGQESTFDEVWRCLTEQEAGIIGLYGLGGVGKTTLLKQINNMFRNQQHNFKVVIWAVVSKEPKIEKIQDDIGNRIGLSGESWKSKSVEDKASDISNGLSQKKFVLLLDDLWQRIELSELGIPLQSLNIGCKILFTTRSLDVCGQMDAKWKFEVKCLTDEEAWRLFEEKTGLATLKADAGILEQAKMVASECDGLPLALITIGRAMASKWTLQEWKNVLRDLRTTASKFSGMEEKVFSRLKYSYDNLLSNITRSCFLYCCLFPEDFEILKEDLIHYWISEEFLKDFDDGYTVIGDLLRACLLEEEGDHHVKMHDVIRDMALWIACKIEKEEENLLVRSGARLTKAPKIEEWKGAKRISLIQNEIKSLSEIPTCPRLLTLLLDANFINIISDGLFEFMPSLRVLSLRRNRFLEQLPSGLSSLVLLRHLDLSYTRIRWLPQELKALVNLRYLNLEGAEQLHEIPRQLLSSFSKLQVLRTLDCIEIWNDPPEDSVLSDDYEPLMELLCLDFLNEFSVTLERSRGLQIILTSKNLLSCTQSLHLDGLDSPLDVLSLAYMKNLKWLRVESCSLKEMKPDCREEVKHLLQSGFRSLHAVMIRNCNRLKDMTWLVFAPNLKSIFIGSFYDLEEIISAEKFREVSEIVGEIGLFAELQVLEMMDLFKLKSIYLNPLRFPKLKQIEIFNCPNLIKLPLNSSSAKERKLVIIGDENWWNDLEWEDEDTKDAFSTCFE